MEKGNAITIRIIIIRTLEDDRQSHSYKMNTTFNLQLLKIIGNLPDRKERLHFLTGEYFDSSTLIKMKRSPIEPTEIA